MYLRHSNIIYNSIPTRGVKETARVHIPGQRGFDSLPRYQMWWSREGMLLGMGGPQIRISILKPIPRSSEDYCLTSRQIATRSTFRKCFRQVCRPKASEEWKCRFDSGLHQSTNREVAQSGRAGALDASSRWFESSPPDQNTRRE